MRLIGPSQQLSVAIAAVERSPGQSHLPLVRSPLIGRERDLAAVRDLFLSDDVPLLMLTGPGGVGKTRLAQQVALDLQDEFADGVSFVPLAAFWDPARMAAALAQALGVPEIGTRSPLEALRQSLRRKEHLLVLDNFEHLVEAAPLITDLLTWCPRLKVLVTSRSALRLSDERIYPVPPLALPHPADLPPVEELARIDGVALFVQRAAAVSPGFALTADNAAAVAEICVRLDGLPLALELAAARTRLLPPTALLARLTPRLALLTRGARDQPARLRSLRDAIAWSHDLLAPAEQVLFRRLAVFVGGFTLEAAEWVSGVGCQVSETSRADASPAASQHPTPDTRHPTPDTLDLIGALVEQSLLYRQERADSEPRFAMLETIREYAREQLERSGEAESVRRRHATWFATFAATAEGELRGREQLAWLARLETEHDNLRAALTWALAQEDAGLALRLSGALHLFWFHHGHWAEGRRWLEPALAASVASASDSDRAKALAGLGYVSFVLSDYAAARAWLEESIAVSREAGDERSLAYAMHCLVTPLHVQGDYTAARQLAGESLALFRALDDRWGIAAASCALGLAEIDLGADLDHARALLAESHAAARELGDAWIAARAALCLGELARGEGDYERAESLYDEALTLSARLSRSSRVPHLIYYKALYNLGQIAALRRDSRRGTDVFGEGLSLLLDLGDRRGQGLCLAGLATTAALLGQPERAARLFGAADALFAAAGVTMEPVDRAVCEPHRDAVRSQLGPEAYDAAWEAGATRPPSQAIADALAFAAQVGAAVPDDAPPDQAMGLSRREQEVLRLLVEGHSNPDIADTLFISHATVRNHVTSILSKLGVETRTAAATFALRHGLV